MRVHVSHQRPLQRTAVVVAVLSLGLVLAEALPTRLGIHGIPYYAALHAMLEAFAVIVAMLIFAVGWHAYGRDLPGNTVLLACAFLGVGILDFSHSISFSGMPDFVTPSSPQKGIAYWLAARALAGGALLSVALTPWRPLRSPTSRYLLLGSVLASVALVHWLILFHPDALPDTFDPVRGLTTFKVAFEYAIAGVNLVTAGLLWHSMGRPQSFNTAAMFGAVCVMALSECFFMHYTRVNDLYNLTGHLYKVTAYLFLYRAVFVDVFEEPYRKLAATRSELKAMLDAVPDLLFELDLQGTYHAVHSRRPDLLMRPAEALYGRTVHDVLPPAAAAAVIAALHEAHAAGVSSGRQLELPMLYGPRWFELSVSRKGEDAGPETRFIVLSRDITERKQAAEAMLDREVAVRASAAKSEFLSSMSHELRTPLNAVLGFSHLLLNTESAPLTANQRRQVGYIHRAGAHLLTMINEILDLSRIEAGRTKVTMARLSIAQLLTESLPMVLPQAEERGVKVIGDDALCEDFEVIADEQHLKQVVLNVLSNAVKYNRASGTVTLRTERRGELLAVIFEDTGSGLTTEQLAALFQPFNRLGADQSVEGTGLGLVVSRRLMEAMGGSISVESQVGVGTVVTLLLRAADTSPAAPEAPKPIDELLPMMNERTCACASPLCSGECGKVPGRQAGAM